MKLSRKTLAVGLVLWLLVCGCGNVYLRGEAKTAVKQSAALAEEAARRAEEQEAEPAWVQEFLRENAKWWDAFKRAADGGELELNNND